MPEKQDLILKRIKFIRKAKRRSIHDCARILGLSKEAYHSIEKGNTPISMPELELLAIYLGENPSEFISSDQQSPSKSAYLNDDIRPQFLKIREKMLRALIALERESRSITLENIQHATQIPLETLQAYDNGTSPMPIGDLIKVCAFLEIPMDSLNEPVWPDVTSPRKDQPEEDWQPEFEKDDSLSEPPHEDPYSDILRAFQKVPKQDQAYIAKYLLEKLRSM